MIKIMSVIAFVGSALDLAHQVSHASIKTSSTFSNYSISVY
jgi:hypothetical protein